MPIDDRTTTRNYPKPAAANLLSGDVGRLRDALDAIDADMAARATTAALDAAIAALKGSAPAALDTLGELATSLGGDPDFVGSMVVALAGKVPTARQVIAGTGLQGGGALSADRTLSLTAGVLASLALADSAVQPGRTVFTGTGLQGGGDLSANRTLSLTAAVLASLALADTAVQPARSVATGTGLQGGGDLSANRTLSLTAAVLASLALADTSLQPGDRASQAEAEAGASATKLLTPLGAKQFLDANPPGVKVVAKTAAYQLAATDQGTLISITTGGITVPSSLPAGTTVSIYNNSASNQTITQGASVTLRLAGTTTTGNRTLAGYGLCTVQVVASGVAVILGSGLS